MSINFCYSCGEKVESETRCCASCGCVLRKGVARRFGLGCCFGCIICFLVIVAMVAIPGLIRSKISANESSAIGRVRTVVDAQGAYHEANGRYAETFDQLSSETPSYLRGGWSIPRSGYVLKLDGDGDSFTVHADPVVVGETGFQFFFSDESGVVRYNTEESASKDDAALGEAPHR